MPSSVVTFFPIPTAGTVEGTANYTIAVDEFANMHMAVSVSGVTRTTLPQGSDCSVSNANSGVVMIDDGDTITTSASAGSASTTSTSVQLTATSDAYITVNATQVIRVQCQMAILSPGSSNTTNIDGTANATYLIARFDK